MRALKPFVVLVAGVVMGTALLSGCESSGGKDDSAAAPREDAMMCTKCETVWVATHDFSSHAAHAKGHSYTMYRTEKKMVCPDCETAVAHFFKTGELEHSCKTCGDTLRHCKSH